jgi:hypothetical protein
MQCRAMPAPSCNTYFICVTLSSWRKIGRGRKKRFRKGTPRVFGVREERVIKFLLASLLSYEMSIMRVRLMRDDN